MKLQPGHSATLDRVTRKHPVSETRSATVETIAVPSHPVTPASRPVCIPSARSQQEAARDAILVRRCQAGDAGAFDEIVAHYRAKLMFTALRVLRDRQDAEEIAQDVLARAYRALPLFRGDCSLDTWLTRIAMNSARNRYWYFVRRHRRAWVSLDDTGDRDDATTVMDNVSDTAAGPARALAAAEFSALVTQNMKRLAPGHRKILALRSVLDRSYEDIARNLKIGIGTVKSRIGRARGELRKRLAESCPEFPADASPSAWFERDRACGRMRALSA